jgi:hypothetical protein
MIARRQSMDWGAIAVAATAGALGVAVLTGVVVVIGRLWHTLHDRQIDHMQRYGDRERNE